MVYVEDRLRVWFTIGYFVNFVSINSFGISK